jgi:Family of unknown function (DUF5329)
MTRFSPAGAFRRRLALLVLQLPLMLAAFAGEQGGMDAEIDYLITQVAASDCTFIRNGREHDAEAASEHLQMKRERGKRHYDTTEQFLERIASKSSWSGKEYRIRCGGTTSTTKEWFSARLAAYRESRLD